MARARKAMRAGGCRAGHEDVYATMDAGMVAFAAARDFVALDAMIRKYQTRCDELDDKPPEDKNGLYLSHVGNRWALKGDLDALAGEKFLTVDLRGKLGATFRLFAAHRYLRRTHGPSVLPPDPVEHPFGQRIAVAVDCDVARPVARAP